MKKMNKKGFFFAEGLLIVLTIVAVAGVGIYIKGKLDDRPAYGETGTTCKPGLKKMPIFDGKGGTACLRGIVDEVDKSDQASAPTTQELKNLNESVAANESSTEATPGIFCAGDGVSGNRIQAVYVTVPGGQNRSTTIGSGIKVAAAFVERTFEQSALKTGGNRHVRWVTNANCALDIKKLTLPNLDAATLYNQGGLNQANRKYLIFADVGTASGGYSGVTYFSLNNTVSYSSAYNDFIFKGATASHELIHALSSGQPGTHLISMDAPHSTGQQGNNHCSDGHDLMCYDDVTGIGGEQQIVCPDYFSRYLFDCNNDDYYSTNPPANSWLRQNPTTNVANSSFLAATGGPVTPINDFWADATKITNSTSNVTLTGNTTKATTEYQEPNPNITGQVAKRTIWYTLKPTRSGYVTIKTYTGTSTSSIDTLLSVFNYTVPDFICATCRPDIRTLSLIGSNDNYSGTGSRVRFFAQAGKDYRIAVDGKNGAQGSVILSIVPQ